MTYRQFFLATIKVESPRRYGYDWFCAALDALWTTKPKMVDWLDMEQCMCDLLSSTWLTDEQKVRLMQQVIDVYTRRGHFAAVLENKNVTN